MPTLGWDMMYRPGLGQALVFFGVLSAVAAIEPSPARGVGQDELRAVYANRFGFDRRGVPLV